MTNYDINTEFVKSPGVLNAVGNKIQVEFRFNTSDKGVCIIFGSHNATIFMSAISFNRDGIMQQVNLIGSLGIESAAYNSNTNCLVIRCNTSKYGTCTVASTISIEYVKFTN